MYRCPIEEPTCDACYEIAKSKLNKDENRSSEIINPFGIAKISYPKARQLVKNPQIFIINR